MWVFAIVVVLLIGAITVVAMGRGAAMTPVFADRPDSLVPDHMLTSRDLRHVQFAIGVRGYRMDEVDSLLDRLAEELAVREAREAREMREAREANEAHEAGEAGDEHTVRDAAANQRAEDPVARERDSGAGAREGRD
jgi:DivIVA domain-containing protein